MKIKVKEAFESRKIKGKMIPAGLHDLAEEWAKELIERGIAEPCEYITKFHPETETRVLVEPKKETRNKRKNKK